MTRRRKHPEQFSPSEIAWERRIDQGVRDLTEDLRYVRDLGRHPDDLYEADPGSPKEDREAWRGIGMRRPGLEAALDQLERQARKEGRELTAKEAECIRLLAELRQAEAFAREFGGEDWEPPTPEEDPPGGGSPVAGGPGGPGGPGGAGGAAAENDREEELVAARRRVRKEREAREREDEERER